MEFFETVKNRRSIRSFTCDEILENEIKQLIDAARLAPSAGNVQPWNFIIVKNNETKHKLAKAALDQSFIEEAPVVIVVLADLNRSKLRYGNRGVNLYCIQDTAAATQNILLAAVALGLGACWVGAFQEDMVKIILKIPEDFKPVAIIPIGKPAGKVNMPQKRPIEEIIHYETFVK
ncbi:nitroreductase family protein [Candidatus Bathyarchaeota archaeon]|nr:nitroreductase family protein [Candidatus Bathyarchaeota archaeon]